MSTATIGSSLTTPVTAPAPGLVLPNIAFLWLTTGIAATALWPIYQSTQLVVLVVVAALLGTAIASLGAIFRWPAWLVLLVTIATYALSAVPLAIPSRAMFGVLPTASGLLDLATATALSWKQLLTITLPVGSYQALLVPAMVLVLGTTVLGTSVALRVRRGELAVFAPIALFIVATMFGSTTATWPLQTALGLLAAVLLWLVWWRWRRRSQSIRLLAAQAADADGRPLETVRERGFPGFRTLASAALIMVIAVAAAVATTLVLPPTHERQVLRSSIVQPFDPRSYPSPLSGFRKYELPAAADSAMLTVTGLPEGGRIRVATLDTYDGIVYSVGSGAIASESGSFTRVPFTFDQSSVRGQQVRLQVTVDGYQGVWLPTAGKFESVDFGGADGTDLRGAFYYNDTSGTAAVVRPLARGDSYTLTAVEPIQPTSLDSLRPGTAEVPRVGVLPDQLASSLDDWVRGITSPGQQLAAMVAALKEKGYISHGVSATEPASRSGHAADRITELLTDQRMIGDQEQYAVTAALMARQLGFPARVVFGFAPAVIAAGGATTITGSDVSAWIEVDTAQYGWVTVDPNPAVRDIPQEQPQDPTTIARPQSPVQPPVEEPQATNGQVPPDSTRDNPAALDPFLAIFLAVLSVVGWVLLAVAIVLAPFLAVVAAKLRRRRLRRTSSTPLLRISGGWEEFEDSILDRGFEPPASATRTEVAATVGGMQSLVLASIADRAVFAPAEPEPEQADLVWRSVHDLVAGLDTGRTRWQRIRAAISLRSLGGYSFSKFFSR
ncbi:MAG: transglutaminase protein [Microbacteriaceae bacterium]|nr:transglutaminase protein [Microbacteriaceae bacterium]